MKPIAGRVHMCEGCGQDFPPGYVKPTVTGRELTASPAGMGAPGSYPRARDTWVYAWLCSPCRVPYGKPAIS